MYLSPSEQLARGKDVNDLPVPAGGVRVNTEHPIGVGRVKEK
jgi:hypothetical protein